MAQTENPDRGDGSWATRYLQLPYTGSLLPVSTGQPEILDWYSRQYLHNLSLSVDIFGAWLTGSRKLVDTWRDSLRSQQDSLLSGMRQQLETCTEVPQTASPDAVTFPAPSARSKRESVTARQPQG